MKCHIEIGRQTQTDTPSTTSPHTHTHTHTHREMLASHVGKYGNILHWKHGLKIKRERQTERGGVCVCVPEAVISSLDGGLFGWKAAADGLTWLSKSQQFPIFAEMRELSGENIHRANRLRSLSTFSMKWKEVIVRAWRLQLFLQHGDWKTVETLSTK